MLYCIDMNFKDRLKQAREEKALTQGQLGELAGITQAAIQSLESGRVKSTTHLVDIAAALGVTPEWLQHGKLQAPPNAKSITLSSKTKKLPLIDWQFVEEYVKFGRLTFPYQEIEVDEDSVSDKAVVLVVQGDSMEGKEAGRDILYQGDIVIIDLLKAPAPYATVLIKNQDELWLRLYVQHGTHVELKPLNKEYPSIKLSSQIEILGVVAEIRRKK